MKNAKILIVDDDYDFADSLSELIEDQGYFVEVVYSGEEAVSKFSEQDFDIALIDMKLPGMNGVESFFEFRKINPDTKVIMMTGYGVEELICHALKEGVVEVLQKPLNMPRLLDLISTDDKSRKIDILLVDDDEEFALSTNDFLCDQGFSVAVVSSGHEAMEIVKAFDIGTLIMDLRMPVMDGLGVYKELKKQNLLLPIIIMTAYRAKEAASLNILQSMASLGYLYKPFDPLELLKLVNVIMQNRAS